MEEEQPPQPPPPPAMGVVSPEALFETDANMDIRRLDGFPHLVQAAVSADLENGRISSKPLPQAEHLYS